MRKMAETGIQKLKSYKNQILLLEIGALIHDLGKLNEEFVERKDALVSMLCTKVNKTVNYSVSK